MERSEVPEEFVEVEPRMTPSQKSYLLDLINSREMSDKERREAVKRITGGLTKREASAWIDRALALPKQSSEYTRRGITMPKVDDGRYAVMVWERIAGDDVETLKFFKVKTPDEGRWQGFTFLDAGRGGAHGDLQWTPVKDLEYKMKILGLIEKDPKAAGMRFGQEIGVCCRCGRSLTDITSRELGIGPDCREMAGW